VQVHIIIRLCAAFALMAVCLPLFPSGPLFNAEEDGVMPLGIGVQEWEFHEHQMSLPSYPEQKKLVPVDIDAPYARFKYFIDPESIQVGNNGLTSQLTMIIEARSGYQNILVERYRCDTHGYKTLAYGTGSKTFHRYHDPVWENISRRSGSGLDYRRDLITFYLCDGNGAALPKREILRRVAFPDDISTSGNGF